MRVERRLRVFENRVLGRIYGPKRDEVTWKWRRLHDEELYDLYSSSNIVRVKKKSRIGWAGHVASMKERRCVHRVLVGKSEGKSPHGRHRQRWKDNIKIDVHQVLCRCMDWIELAQDTDRWRACVNAVMNFRVP
jgi:hypothetical protein